MSLRLFDILRCIACPRSKISFFSTSPNSIYTTSIPSTTSQAKLALDVKRRKKRDFANFGSIPTYGVLDDLDGEAVRSGLRQQCAERGGEKC